MTVARLRAVRARAAAEGDRGLVREVDAALERLGVPSLETVVPERAERAVPPKPRRKGG